MPQDGSLAGLERRLERARREPREPRLGEQGPKPL
jgi:hypothetical protein